MADQPDPKKEHKITSIVAMSMFAGVLIYAAVVEIIAMRQAPFAGYEPQLGGKLREAFYLVAVLTLMVVRVVRNQILRATPSDDLRALIGKLRIAAIISFALCEIPAVLGLVLFLTAGFRQEFYILLLLSLLGMTVYFPKYAHWEQWISRNTRSR